MRQTDHGVIYRNPLPGHRVINAFFPTLCHLDGEAWLCAVRIAGAIYSPDGVIHLFRSDDGCQTWSDLGPWRSREADGGRYNDNLAELTRLRDGTLVLRLMRLDHSNPDLLVYNHQTQGMLPVECCYAFSTDEGVTWSSPTIPDTASMFEPHLNPAPIAPVIERPDGSWFQIFETWKHYEDAGPFQLQTYGLISRDRGGSWSHRVTIANGQDRGTSYSHAYPTVLGDGRVLVSLWTAESQLQEQHDLHAVVSDDGAMERWSAPYSLGAPGQTSSILRLRDDVVLLLYCHRENTEQPGIKLVRSEDGGRTFDNDSPLLVWDAYGKEALGVPRTATYPSSHDAIGYGAPRIYREDDRHAVASFWCTLGADTHARWARIEL